MKDIEPDCSVIAGGLVYEDILVSIAISLKRIADALEKLDEDPINE